MPHFKVSDDSHSHPKVIMAGDAAWGMWNRAGCWSTGYGTDGFIPDWWVKQQPQGVAKAKRLVAAQLWHRGEYEGDRPEYQGIKGYNFHEWRQDSYEKVEADRKKWRDKKTQQRATSPPMSPGDNTRDTPGDSQGDSRESPGYIPNTLKRSSGYVPEAARESNARDAAAATSGAELVKRAVPPDVPAPTRTALRLAASELVNTGTSPEVVSEALRDWVTKTGVGPGILASLAADIIKRRNGHASPLNAPKTGPAPAARKVKTGLELASKLGENQRQLEQK